MSKNIVLFSMVVLLAAACGGEVTTETGETTGEAGGSAGGGAQAGAAGQPGGGKGGAGGSTGVAGTSAAGTSAAGTGQAGTGTAGTSPAAGSAGVGGYNPCAGLTCGTQCDPCPPNADCAPSDPFYCDAQGKCNATFPVCEVTSCKADKDCPQYDNGTQGYCVNNQCVYVPLNPCQGKPCGAICTTCPPGQACPPVVEQCNAQGKCTTDAAVCDEPPTMCQTDKDCPVDDGCFLCNDGTLACPTATCAQGICVNKAGVCPAECTQPSDCPQPKGPCKVCPNDQQSCPTATCTNGQCNVEYLPACGGVSGACDPVKVTGTGNCKKPELLGYYWDGDSCEALTACQCAGDCGQLTATAKECVSAHMGCTPVPAVCAAQQAEGTGMCKKLIGYKWNGSTCDETVVGCECVGKDCNSLYGSPGGCSQAHAVCTADACAGKSCGAICTTCKPGEACPEVVQHCDIFGLCSTSVPACD